MPRILHIVVTDAFAGAERYVCEVATETARRGWEVCVVGGRARGMRAALGSSVGWEPGATVRQAIRTVLRLGRWDICHVQMTAAEAVAVATRPVHRAPVVTTRQFAARRGASLLGRVGAPWIAAGITREIAVSEFIAEHIERTPAAVVVSGVSQPTCLWRADSRVVLIMQRLEAEKDTITALEAWKSSGLATDGWSLRVVGEGSLRAQLESWVEAERVEGVTFVGWTADVAAELAGAGMLLASAPAEPLGLSVIEAMAAGVPVVASAGGGHLETAGLIEGAPLYRPGDALGAAAAMRCLLDEAARARLSADGRRLVSDRFTVKRHVDRLFAEYDAARSHAHLPDLRLASVCP